MTYKFYRLTDENGLVQTYEATDMRMAMAVHQGLVGTEPVEVKVVDKP